MGSGTITGWPGVVQPVSQQRPGWRVFVVARPACVVLPVVLAPEAWLQAASMASAAVIQAWRRFQRVAELIPGTWLAAAVPQAIHDVN
mgnify:CR=1 FL=1